MGVEEIKRAERTQTYAVFIGLIFLATLIFLLAKATPTSEAGTENRSSFVAFKRCFSLLATKKMLLLLIPFLYTGKLISSPYSTLITSFKHHFELGHLYFSRLAAVVPNEPAAEHGGVHQVVWRRFGEADRRAERFPWSRRDLGRRSVRSVRPVH